MLGCNAYIPVVLRIVTLSTEYSIRPSLYSALTVLLLFTGQIATTARGSRWDDLEQTWEG